MIRNPRVMDDDREPQGCVYAFSDHKAVLATATRAVNEKPKLKVRGDLWNQFTKGAAIANLANCMEFPLATVTV